MIDALIDVAETRGYHVRWHRGGPKAAWLPHQHAVSLRHGMSDADTLCALAHELGHAHYNDPPGHHGAHEQRADRFAARLLISPVEYAMAEHAYGTHPARLAAELGVTTHLINVWQDLYERGLYESRMLELDRGEVVRKFRKEPGHARQDCCSECSLL